MFERSLRRVESKEDATVVGGSQGFVANVQTTPSTSTNDLLLTTMRVGRKRSKSRSSTTERSLRLTAEQKCDVAQREIEAVQEDVRHMEDESERVLDHYRVGGSFALLLCVQQGVVKQRIRTLPFHQLLLFYTRQ